MSGSGKASGTRARPARPARHGATRKAVAATRKRAAPTRAREARVPRFRGSPRQRLTAVLERLDRRFGEVAPGGEVAGVLDKAVFLVLREGNGSAAALRSLQALRAGFIDWNEVRASRPTELSAMLGGAGRTAAQKPLLDAARRVKDVIDQVYGDRNDTTLEFLLEKKSSERLEYLEDLDDLGVHNAWALAQWLSGEDKLVGVSPNMAKAAQRLGLVPSAAVAKVRSTLSALVKEPVELVVVQAHLTQLGEMEESQWPPTLREFVA